MDDILERARMLAKAANEVAENMSEQAKAYKSIVETRKQESQHIQEQEIQAIKEKNKCVDHRDIGNRKVCHDLFAADVGILL